MCTSLCNKLYDSFSPSAFETDLEGAIIDYQARAAWRRRPSEKKLTAQQAVPQNMPHRPARRRACTPARERSRHRRSKLVFRSGETTPRPGAEVVPQTQPISRHPKPSKTSFTKSRLAQEKQAPCKRARALAKAASCPIRRRVRRSLMTHTIAFYTPKLPSASEHSLSGTRRFYVRLFA